MGDKTDPTIHDIVKIAEKSPSNKMFFSPQNLAFFGQTLEDFEVVVSPKGRVFFYAPLMRPRDGNEFFTHPVMKPSTRLSSDRIFGGYTFKEVEDDMFLTPHYGDEGESWRPVPTARQSDLREMLQFIKDN